ncbi:MAG TPA: RNA polymerase factor sigma-54, partial [Bacillales bacterium]|nr:RNA polymerase factor sigma-54 [Bacillales bacterium]
ILLLDDDGYLPENVVAETAEELRLSEKEIEQVLWLLQKLEPAGIGARNLKECLILQINRIDPADNLARGIVECQLSLLAEKSWGRLADEFSVSVGDVEEAAALIQTLNPKPGSVYDTGKTRFTEPDLTVIKEENRYVVVLHDDFLPTIRLSPHYNAFLSNKGKNEAAEYVQNKYKQMMWLVKSIEQRRMTLVNVTEMIVRKQQRFLENGMRYLVPMTLKEVADELDIHESTVSRAVRNKMIQTPNGLYELKSFFTSRVNTSSGEGTSSASVKLLIKDMIRQEDGKHPFSDQKIASVLENDHGIAVSRRTVAKYREQMNISSSTKRKKSYL